jgi:cytochrome c biogenesis protein CcdA
LFVIVIAPDYNGLLRAVAGGLVILFGEFAMKRYSKPEKKVK